MEAPQFSVGQKVKFNSDHDSLTGQVLEIAYNSQTGYHYTISSRYYDAELNNMVEGVKHCTEAELVDMEPTPEA